jgi:hypothetical protein
MEVARMSDLKWQREELIASKAAKGVADRLRPAIRAKDEEIARLVEENQRLKAELECKA